MRVFYAYSFQFSRKIEKIVKSDQQERSKCGSKRGGSEDFLLHD